MSAYRGCTGDCVQGRQECPTPMACWSGPAAEPCTEVGQQSDFDDEHEGTGVLVWPLLSLVAIGAVALLVVIWRV